MDKGKVVRLVLIPIVLGLVVTLIVRQLLGAGDKTAAAGEVELAPVVVIAATEAVPANTKLTEQHIIVKQLPKAYLTGYEFSSMADVTGKVSLIPLEPGAMLLQAQVVAEGHGRMPYRVPAGKRAITIRIDELTGVAGHPEPGDLVDMVLVLTAKEPDRLQTTSRMLFESVQVLSKGPASQQPADGSAGGNLSSLTLAMTPEQSTEVALAEQIGHIKLLLRPALKEGEIGRRTFSEAMYGGAAATPR